LCLVNKPSAGAEDLLLLLLLLGLLLLPPVCVQLLWFLL
jgi:hypothetical protein